MSRTLIGVSMNDDSVRLLCQCFVPLHSVSKNTKSFHILSDPLETTTWSTWSYCKKYWSKGHDRNFRKEPIQSGFIYLVVWAARLIHLQFYQTALFLSCLLLTTFTANSPCLDPLLIVFQLRDITLAKHSWSMFVAILNSLVPFAISFIHLQIHCPLSLNSNGDPDALLSTF